MVMVTNWIRVIASAMAVTTSCIAAGSVFAAVPSFSPIGFLTGGSITQSYSGHISDDGTVITGQSFDGASKAFHWSTTSSMVDIGFTGFGRGVSADGSVIVGENGTPEAIRWTQGTGAVGIGFIPGKSGNAKSIGADVSDDGSVVVGQGGQNNIQEREAFRWTQAGGMVGLGSLAAGVDFDSVGEGVSADGSVVVGYSNSSAVNGGFEAFRWTQAGGMVGLGVVNTAIGTARSRGFGVSDDGNVVVGSSRENPGPSEQPSRWTSATGMVLIDTLGLNEGRALDANGDGSVVVGRMGGGNGQAFIWDTINGTRNLQDVLISDGLGAELTDWTLWSATSVTDTAEGLVLLGYGGGPNTTSNDRPESFRVVMSPIPEPASVVLMGLGGLMMMFLCLSRRRQA